MELLFIISGPAGVGKTTICDRLLQTYPNIDRIITATSRLPRSAERNGYDYYFFSREVFKSKIQSGDFYEYAEVHGNYYGSLKLDVDHKWAQGLDLLLNIDVQGAKAFREAAKQDQNLASRLVTIFIRPPHIDLLRERMLNRNLDEKTAIEARLKNAENEISEAKYYDYCIESRSKDEDFAAIEAIYKAEKERRFNRNKHHFTENNTKISVPK